MTDEERKLALYCLKASSDYHSEVCEECIKYPNCDHTGQDDVIETIIKALEQQPCEEAISREDALMALTEEWTELTDKLIHRFIKRIKALPPVNPQLKWSPVSEGLPKKPGVYTVTDSKGDVARFVFNDTESSREYWLRCAKAWMFIEPYREDGETGETND